MTPSWTFPEESSKLAATSFVHCLTFLKLLKPTENDPSRRKMRSKSKVEQTVKIRNEILSIKKLNTIWNENVTSFCVRLQTCAFSLGILRPNTIGTSVAKSWGISNTCTILNFRRCACLIVRKHLNLSQNVDAQIKKN